MPILLAGHRAGTGATLDLGQLVVDRLVGLPFTTYRGIVPATPPGAYVVLYFGAGVASSTRLDGSPRQLQWTFRAVCCGFSEQQALNTTDLVRLLLTGWRPQPDVRAAGALHELDYDPPLLRDDSVANDIRFSLTLTYRLTTTRSL